MTTSAMVISVALAAGLAAPLGAQSTRPEANVIERALGLPGRDTRPPETRFVLPHTDPILASEAPPGLRAPSNFFGMPGAIDTPMASPLPDGELTANVSSFAGITRTALSFQLTPRLTGAFRYNRFDDINLGSFVDYYDRAFDIQYQLVTEGPRRPGIAIGLRDFIGTGLEAAEYVVATKTFALQGGGTLRASGGLGWGRLGTFGAIGSPFSEDRPTFVLGSTGGQAATDQWFRGPAAPFASLEWQPTERLRLKAEYSSDDYPVEAADKGMFERRSPLNFGIEYQATDAVRLGLYSMYGDAIGGMVSVALNPRRSGNTFIHPSPGPVVARPSRTTNPELWSAAWHGVADKETQIAPRIEAALGDQDIKITGLDFPSPREARISIRNSEYDELAMAIGRTARAMAASLPPTVETFRIVPESGGVARSVVTLQRSDLEGLEGRPDRVEALAARTAITAPTPGDPVTPVPGVFPRFKGGIAPYLSTSTFDPRQPLRADVGVAANGEVELRPGLTLSGNVRKKLAGNIGEGVISSSKLPPVRTNSGLYAREDGVTLNRLTLAYAGALSPTLYGRVTAGYLEQMFGGVSGEVLWKPVDSRLALGAELNYARQRDFDQRFGFQDYDVVTGHLSAYYDFGNGFTGQLDVGRYLAGDVGATVTLDRAFANGWKVGAFATMTDVSAEDFGEGSFDKGIRVVIPVQSILGTSETSNVVQTIRPVQRDGGARLMVPGRLYDRVQGGHQEDLFADWGRVWR
ncbi:MAG: YjbH domain-containing protein [Shimia sp.]